MAQHNELGKKGEKIAQSYLKKHGCQILAVNFRYQHAEIDIIASKLNVLFFVEVKTRTSCFFGYPEEFISVAQQERIRLAAQFYIDQNQHEGTCRFDICAISFQEKSTIPSIYYIKDVFF